MFSCALCESEWAFGQNVCKDCRQIRHLMNIYSKEAVLLCLNKCLVINKFKKAEIKEPTEPTEADDQKDYDRKQLHEELEKRFK